MHRFHWVTVGMIQRIDCLIRKICNKSYTLAHTHTPGALIRWWPPLHCWSWPLISMASNTLPDWLVLLSCASGVASMHTSLALGQGQHCSDCDAICIVSGGEHVRGGQLARTSQSCNTPLTLRCCCWLDQIRRKLQMMELCVDMCEEYADSVWFKSNYHTRSGLVPIRQPGVGSSAFVADR